MIESSSMIKSLADFLLEADMQNSKKEHTNFINNGKTDKNKPN
jgi:hypothetical protein